MRTKPRLLSPYTQARERFEAGYAKEAARILQLHAKNLVENTKEDDYVARRKSDQVAMLATKFLLTGDAPARQQYERKHEQWQYAVKEYELKFEKLDLIVGTYAKLFAKLVKIVDEGPYRFESLRRMREANRLEHYAHFGELNFANDKEFEDYLLGNVRYDIDRFIGYTFSFSHSFPQVFFRRKIREGCAHEYLEILLVLEDLTTKFDELKILQDELITLLAVVNMPYPKPSISEEFESLLGELQNLITQDAESTSSIA